MRSIKYLGIILFITLAGCQSEIPADVEEVAAKKVDVVKKLTKEAEEIANQDTRAVAELEKDAEAYNDSGTTNDTTESGERYARGRSEDFGNAEGDAAPVDDQDGESEY